MAVKTTPDTPSSDYAAMLPYWNMSEAILGGADKMRAAGSVYLPQFPNETETDYEYRRVNAKFTNVFSDIVSTLSAKPFGEEISLVEGSASDAILALAEDIDGRGNNLHVFASNVFFGGVANAVDWILVDYTRARTREDGRRLSIDEERTQGLRPYWVHIPAKRMLAAYTDVVNGKEIFVHARMQENLTRREGYDEESIERVRILNRDPVYEVVEGFQTDRIVGYAPATFEVHERRAKVRGQGSAWELVDSGVVTLGVIALVPFMTGRRIGGGWRFEPPMKPAAELQIEHYQQETALKSIKELTAFPMLAGNGVAPPMVNGAPVQLSVGPKKVLYAPPSGDNGQHGEWAFIEPGATSLRFLADDVANTEKQLRELGRQPLIASQGITVVAAAYASQKASSILKSWALGLKDALEQALKYTAMWLGDPSEPTISWNLDELDLDQREDDGSGDLIEARKNGDLSQETLWDELKRRGKLSADFEPDKERKRLEDETPDPDGPSDMADALPPDADPEERVAA